MHIIKSILNLIKKRDISFTWWLGNGKKHNKTKHKTLDEALASYEITSKKKNSKIY